MIRANALALPAVLLILCACTKKEAVEAAPKAQPLAVKTVAAATRRVDRIISVTGSLNPDETVNVSFEVAGRVLAIHTDFGQVVHKGDVLADLDKQEYQLQVDRTR